MPARIIALVLAAAVTTTAAGKFDQSQQEGSAACRTYPRRVVQDTQGTAGRTVLTSRGGFDVSAKETRLEVTFEQSGGARFSNRQIAEYDSVADFIREVRVVPGINLWKVTRITGTPAMVVTNEFDSQGRVARTTTSQPGTTHVTTNSAWDGFGRPTAGSITRENTLASRFSYQYDDPGRTQTYRVTAGGVDTVYRTEFDARGFAVRMTTTTGVGSEVTTYRNDDLDTVCAGK